MSVQQEVIRGAKSHLGPYATSQGLVPTVCTNSIVLKSSIEAAKRQTNSSSSSSSSSSKALEFELSRWESLIKGVSYLETESDSQPFPA